MNFADRWLYLFIGSVGCGFRIIAKPISIKIAIRASTKFDSAAKLAILVNVAFDKRVTISDVLTEGISGLDPKTVARAPDKAKAIRLVAEAGPEGIRVGPKEININDPICVYGPLNALCLTIEGNWQVTLVGKGAGGIETAQAILRDLVELRELLSSGSGLNLKV